MEMMGPEKSFPYHRRSIRLLDADYSAEGGYFITLVTHQRECLFGKIVNGVMQLSDFGRIAREEWFRTKDLRPNVELVEEEFVVMPNHIHGIIWLFVDNEVDQVNKSTSKEKLTSGLVLNGACKGTARRALTQESFGNPISGSLSTIVGAYKSAVTKRINQLRNTPSEKVWLRNYYEHIIETEKEYDNIVNYIESNPKNWGIKDEYYQ